MITTITLNASVDKKYEVEGLSLHTVMRVKKVENTPGGKGLNVTRVIALTGEEVKALGLLGGFNGQYIRSMLKDQGISEEFTQVSVETRSCINIVDTASGLHTEFLEPGLPITPDDLARFMISYEQALKTSEVITLSGSAPLGTPAAFYGELIQKARLHHKQIILDASGDFLKESLKSKPTLIKPNHEELAQWTGTDNMTRPQLIKAAQEIHAQGVPYVVVSLGKEGSVMVCEEGILRASPPPLKAANTVGCGDSMVAGFAVGLKRKMSPAEMLRYATAISAASALSPITGHFGQADFDGILPRVRVEKES